MKAKKDKKDTEIIHTKIFLTKYIQEYGRNHDKFQFLSSRTFTKNTDEILGNWKEEVDSMVKDLIQSKLRWSMAFLSPEPHFDWSKVKQMKSDDKSENDKNIFRALTNPKKIQSDSTRRNWPKLTILPNRKILVDGKTVEGVLMPFEKSAYLLVSREISHWFSPCLEPKNDGSFKLNGACFSLKHKQFLSLFLKYQNLSLRLYFTIYKLANF